MTVIRSLISDTGSESQTFSDTQTTMARPAMVGLVRDIQARIAAAGLEGQRICVAVDFSIGTLAAIAAVFETASSLALIPRPTVEAEAEWPAFCDAVLIPPDLTKGVETLRLLPLQAKHPAPLNEDRLYMRTSGTTGTPKWAVHLKSRVMASGQAALNRLPLMSDDRVLLPLPLHHMYGLGSALVPSLLADASVHMVPRGNPLELLRGARSFLPNVMYMVPSQCRSIMALNRSLGKMRLVVLGGDRLTMEEAAAFEASHGAVIGNYGSTETGALTTAAADDPVEMRHGTSGRLLDGIDLALSDDDPEDPAAEGARLLRIRNPFIMVGYCNSDGEMISETPEIWPMGDMVRIFEGGHVAVLGRADHAVKRDGLLVHVREVESAISRVKGVTNCCVISAGQTRRGAGLVGFCSVTPAGSLSEEDILAHCRAELLPREVPDHVIVMASLPSLASGKVNRRALMPEAEKIMEG
jgi:acyl-coenzyme A synthetase/AMP-(fatty) acid ligase